MSWSSSAWPATVLFPSSSVIDQIRLQHLVNWWRTRYENWLMAASMSLVFSDHLREFNTLSMDWLSLSISMSASSLAEVSVTPREGDIETWISAFLSFIYLCTSERAWKLKAVWGPQHIDRIWRPHTLSLSLFLLTWCDNIWWCVINGVQSWWLNVEGGTRTRGMYDSLSSVCVYVLVQQL